MKRQSSAIQPRYVGKIIMKVCQGVNYLNIMLGLFDVLENY